MSQIVEAATKTFTAGGALSQFARVKLSSGVLAAAGVGASDDGVEIGVVEYPTFASGDVATVRLRSSMGTTKMIAAGAIAAGVAVYGAASGKISTTVSGGITGISMEAAGADGDVIEVLRF